MNTIAFAFDLDYSASNEVYYSLRSNGSALFGDWELVPLAYDFETVVVDLFKSGRIDALAGSFISDSWLRSLGRKRIPMVNLSWLSNIQSVPTVTVDDVKVGQVAAENLFEQGWQQFAFAGNPSLEFSRLRNTGFKQVLDNAGCKVLEFPISRKAEAIKWLSTVEEGTVIFSANDSIARRVVLLAKQAERRIPEEIGVLGVGNSQLESIFAGVDISSISLPSEGIGMQAAKVLQAQIEKGPAEPCSYLLPPGPVMERETTRRPESNDAVLEEALLFIRANFSRDLGVDEVAKYSGVSRRSLELRFQKELGHGPYAEIQRLRLEQAEYLLRDTELKIKDVAARCGFPEQHRFSTFFRRWKKLAPKEFRSKIRGSFSLQTPAS